MLMNSFDFLMGRNIIYYNILCQIIYYVRDEVSLKQTFKSFIYLLEMTILLVLQRIDNCKLSDIKI